MKEKPSNYITMLSNTTRIGVRGREREAEEERERER